MGQVGLDVDLPLGPQLFQHCINDNIGTSSANTGTAVSQQRSISFLTSCRGFLDEAKDWGDVVGSPMVGPTGELVLNNITCAARVTRLVLACLPVMAYPQGPHSIVGLK